MKCDIPNTVVLIDNVVLHILILFILISALFLFFISKLTTDHINHEFEELIDQNINPMTFNKILKSKDTITVEQLGTLLNLDPNDPKQRIQIEILLNYIRSINQQDLKTNTDIFKILSEQYAKTPDFLRDSINDKIIEEIIIVIVLLLLFSIIINVLIKLLGKCSILGSLGKELFVVFILVGTIEFWFFNNVGKKFIPVYPDALLNAFKNSINKVLNSNPN